MANDEPEVIDVFWALGTYAETAAHISSVSRKKYPVVATVRELTDLRLKLTEGATLNGIGAPEALRERLWLGEGVVYRIREDGNYLCLVPPALNISLQEHW